MTEKTRYTDEELQEFKALILQKLAKTQEEYEHLCETVTNNGNDSTDTARTFNALEEGANTLEKEHAARMAERQLKFINNLNAASRASSSPRSVCAPCLTPPPPSTPSSLKRNNVSPTPTTSVPV